ncbi:hypothetical protein BLNAU_5520 [Blattamonas nauphoetae]|uniref:Uncharacterized protein n=1 Tax=Blattamonas nauphoetae TaxID=2049346 RepID=A0ABQ9Y6T0_9EUKA|nr:hypothetical protein BLNAU_5520 [Blattamonas nauphoetae]
MNPTIFTRTPEDYAELEKDVHDRLVNSCADRITRRFFFADESFIWPVLHHLQNIDCLQTFVEDIVVNKSGPWIEFTSQIPLLSSDHNFGLNPSDLVPKVHFMSMYLSLCFAIGTLHAFHVPHETLSEADIFFDLAHIAHILPLSNISFNKRSSDQQSCTLKDDLLSATSIFFRLSDQLFDTDNATDCTLDLDIEPETNAPVDRSRLLHLRLSLLAPRPDRQPKRRAYIRLHPPNLISNSSLSTSNPPLVITDELSEDIFPGI